MTRQGKFLQLECILFEIFFIKEGGKMGTPPTRPIFPPGLATFFTQLLVVLLSCNHTSKKKQVALSSDIVAKNYISPSSSHMHTHTYNMYTHTYTQAILLSRIQKCDYSFPDNHWKDVSEDAKNLVSSLLLTDSKLRPSAEEVLRHPWLEQAAPDTPLHTPVVLKR